jgi:nucleoid-associated protein YgaU
MQANPPSEVRSAGAVSLRILIPFLVLFAAGLYELVGLPHAPDPPIDVPDLSSLEAILRSSHPPLDGALYVVGMVAWSVWAWLVLSLLLQVGVGIAEHVSGGTRVVRQAHWVADALSAPLVRRAVRASLAGGLVARVALSAVPAAASAPTETAAFVDHVSPGGGRLMSSGPGFWATYEQPVIDVPSGSIVYTVQPGDNLVGIAERFYGDGDRWQRLYEVNQGRQMADGRTFDRAGVIQPGWQLIVPEPTATIETDSDGQRWYTVRKGDSMAGISARLFGSEQRWPELFAVNEGARLDSQHVLRDPRLIWPGLLLRVPELDLQSAPEPVTPSAADPPPAAQELPDTPSPVATSAVSTAPDASAALLAVSPVTLPVSAAATPEVDSRAAVTETAGSASVATAVPSASDHMQQRLVPPAVGAGAGAAAAIIGVAGTALVLRRRRPRPRRPQAESDVAVNAGYAEAEPLEEICRGAEADDLSTAARIAAHMSREVAAVLARQSPSSAELSVAGAKLAAVRHGRSSTTLMLQDVPMGARQQLIEALPEATMRAFGSKWDVEGMVSVDGDVLIRLTRMASGTNTIELENPASGPEAWAVPSMLLRLGLLADRQIYAANLDAVSHVLVAAPTGHGADAVLTALLASLVAHRSPADLGLIVIGRPHALPDEFLGVSHLLEPQVDPHDEVAALDSIQRVRRELDDRMARCQPEQPDIVLIIPELADLSAEHHAALGAVMLHGPRHHIRLLAASSRRATDVVVDCPLLSEFGTRLVLRAADEEESIALLGSGDATELGSGGHLLVRVEGRVPVQALGYRVSPDRLAGLVALIKERGTTTDWWVAHHAVRGSFDGFSTEIEGDDVGSAPDDRGQQEAGESADTFSEEQPPDDTSVRDDSEQEEKTAAQPPVADDQEDDVARQDTCIADGDVGVEGPMSSVAQMEELGDATDVQPALPLEQHTFHPDDFYRPANGAVCRSPDAYREAALTGAEDHSNGTAAPSTASGKLLARFLGARELLYDGQIVWPVAGVPDEAAMELLVFLGVEDPAGVRADLLSDSLWEEDDEDDEDRSYRLRKRRYRLRRALKRLIPGWKSDPIARMDKQTPIYRLDPNVIESDVHCFLRLLDDGRSLPREGAIRAYEQALDLYRGDLLDRPDVPSYRWLDDGPRVLDLRVKYATMHQLTRRRLADLLATGQSDDELARAQELYLSLVASDALDHRLWEALAHLHGRRNDLLGLEATYRRLRSALVELGEGDDPDLVAIPPTLKRVFDEVRASLRAGRE